MERTLNKPVIGQYILDTLAMGMYNNPLMVVREYIQNSADSIDECRRGAGNLSVDPRIDIQIDLSGRNLTVCDTGVGINQKMAYSTLHDLGRSAKSNKLNRGFRGIGRLGGLGYCDELIFSSKSAGEKKMSVSKWDCRKLARALADRATTTNITDLITAVSTFSQESYPGANSDHFFKVEMRGLAAKQNPLLDIPLVYSYLSQVSPVPYSKSFSYSSEIDSVLRSEVPGYSTYNIFVNGSQVFKPYSDIIQIGAHSADKISGIKYFRLHSENNMLALGWVAETKLLGAISGHSNVDGLRLRSGNIAVGERNLLGDFFRERRFNNYLAGEVHISDHSLVLNSRRDDFEDNDVKARFYEVFLKEIGIPYSSAVRAQSNLRTKNNSIKRNTVILNTVNRIISEGYISKVQQAKIIEDLKEQFRMQNKYLLSQLSDPRATLREITEAKHFLDFPNKTTQSIENKEFLKKVFDVVYSKSTNKSDAEVIIKGILRESITVGSKRDRK